MNKIKIKIFFFPRSTTIIIIITVIRNDNVELPAVIVISERPLGAQM